MAFLRFVVSKSRQGSEEGNGLFGVAYSLSRSNNIAEPDRQLLDDLLTWFEGNLKSPSRFNRTTSKGYYRRNTKGISWFRDTATEHLSRMRELKRLAEEYGYVVELVRADRVGYVTYEDEAQVVAEPFADTPANA
jgi:hypothetical protein